MTATPHGAEDQQGAAADPDLEPRLTGTTSDSAYLNQADRDVNVVGGDSYTARRDQYIYQGSSAASRDIQLVIHHEYHEIELEPGQSSSLSVEVYNHGAKTRRLHLTVRGMPSGVWQISEQTVLVPPVSERRNVVRVRVRLQCQATEPLAGPGNIHILAEDTKTHEFFESGSWKILVKAKPALELLLAGPVTRGPDRNTYTAAVSVRNKGNINLKDELKVASETVLAAHLQLDRSIELVPPSQAHCDGKFDLMPGDESIVRVVIDFNDRPLLSRHRRIPLGPLSGRADIEVQPGYIDIVQSGQLPDALNSLSFIAEGFAEVRRSFLGWCKRAVTLPRGALLGVAVASLLVGVIVALSTAGSLRAAPPRSSAAPMLSPVVTEAARPADLVPYFADWPEFDCSPDSQTTSDNYRNKYVCRMDGIELYFLLYDSHDARNAGRKTRVDAKPDDTCAPGARQGTWSGSAGREGFYVETRYREENGQCWAHIWWDGGDSDPNNAVALLLVAKWDEYLQSSWEPLRATWLNHGYEFKP